MQPGRWCDAESRNTHVEVGREVGRQGGLTGGDAGVSRDTELEHLVSKKYLRRAVYAATHPMLAITTSAYMAGRLGADMLARCSYYPYPHHVIFLAGMAMGGSTWMKQLLTGIPGYYTRHMPMPDAVHRNHDIADSGFGNVPRHGFTVMKTHLNPTPENLAVLRRNGVDRVLVMYRDLRDVAVSRYHRLLAVPKTDGPDYRHMSKTAAIDDSIEVVGQEFVYFLTEWRRVAREDPARHLIVTFEDLKRDTASEFVRVLQFYGIELESARVRRIIERARGQGDFRSNWTRAQALPFGLQSNFRSGTSGHWRDELSEAQTARCKELFGPALIEAGYEQDLDW